MQVFNIIDYEIENLIKVYMLFFFLTNARLLNFKAHLEQDKAVCRKFISTINASLKTEENNLIILYIE